MPIPAGPGGQQEAWRGPGAAAGLFWRPVTLAQIPPRPQECRSLPSPLPCTPTPPPSAEPECRDRASEQGAREPARQRARVREADRAAAWISRAHWRARGQTHGQVSQGLTGHQPAGQTGRAELGHKRPTSTRTLTHTHTYSSHVDRETKTRTEPRKLETLTASWRRCARGTGQREPAGAAGQPGAYRHPDRRAE